MKKFVGILIITLLAQIGTNMGHPVTPYYIEQLGFPNWTFGVFFAVMSLGMLLFAPIWGVLGDVKGRRITLLIGCIFYSIGQVMFGLFKSIPGIIFARFFSGSFSCAVNVSIIAYITSSKDLQVFTKARLVSTVISFQVIGSSLGNYFGGLVSNFIGTNYNYAFFIQAIYLIIVAIISYFVFNMKDEILIKRENKNALSNITDIKKLNLWSILFLFCLTGFSLVFTTLQKYLDIYFRDLGKHATDIGTFNLIIGAVTFTTNLLLTPFLIKKLRPLLAIIISSILGTVCIFITFEFTNIFIGLYTFYMIYIMTKAIIEPASVTYITENKELQPGLMLGVRQSFIALGSIIGPIVGGLIYNNSGVTLFYMLGFLFGACGIGILVLTIFSYKKNIKLKNEV